MFSPGVRVSLLCNPATFQIATPSGFRSEPPSQPATVLGIFSEQATSRDCTQGCEEAHQELTTGGYLDGRDCM